MILYFPSLRSLCAVVQACEEGGHEGHGPRVSQQYLEISSIVYSQMELLYKHVPHIIVTASTVEKRRCLAPATALPWLTYRNYLTTLHHSVGTLTLEDISSQVSMSNEAEAQHGGRLLSLPSEIRLILYKMMFPPEKLDVYAIRGDLHRTMHQQFTAGNYVAALATCRTIYKEGEREKLLQPHVWSMMLIKIIRAERQTHPLREQRIPHPHTGRLLLPPLS